MLIMRTTLTLEEDLASRLKDLAHERGVSFKQVVNEAIRKGLDDERPRQTFKLPTFDMGKPLVDLTKATQLADALDDEEYILKMHRGK